MAVLFPMAPFMVSEWVEVDQVGTWSGMLASAYNLTSILAGVFWGRLSDRVGRVPCIVGVIIGTAASIVLFGLSRSLVHALLARCLGGLFSGMGGLVTAGMRDLTTESQRSTAMASISFAYGVGFSIGPMLGGFLQRPADSFSWLAGSLLDEFPYLLPCLVVAVIVLLSSVGLLWLPPPSKHGSQAQAQPPPTAAPADPASASTADAGAAATDAPPSAVETVEEGDGRRLLAQTPAALQRPRCRLPPVVLLLVAYLFMNFGSIGSMETYPLFLMRNGTDGLGLPPAGLGEVMLPQSLVIMCMPLAYPPLAAGHFGHTGCYYVGAATLMVFSICLPMLRFLKTAPSMLWTCLMILGGLRGTVGPLIFPAMIIITNKVIKDRIGFWNGLMSSVASCARAASPFVFGHLFALGTGEGHRSFPLDVSMPFLLSMLSMGMCTLLVASVPLSSPGADMKRIPSRSSIWVSWRLHFGRRRASAHTSSTACQGAEMSTTNS